MLTLKNRTSIKKNAAILTKIYRCRFENIEIPLFFLSSSLKLIFTCCDRYVNAVAIKTSPTYPLSAGIGWTNPRWSARMRFHSPAVPMAVSSSQRRDISTCRQVLRAPDSQRAYWFLHQASVWPDGCQVETNFLGARGLYLSCSLLSLSFSTGGFLWCQMEANNSWHVSASPPCYSIVDNSHAPGPGVCPSFWWSQVKQLPWDYTDYSWSLT